MRGTHIHASSSVDKNAISLTEENVIVLFFSASTATTCACMARISHVGVNFTTNGEEMGGEIGVGEEVVSLTSDTDALCGPRLRISRC